MIDIMVIVLIFLILTMVPRENRQLVRIVLAQSGAGETVAGTGRWVSVSLNPEGQAFIDGQPLEGDAFVSRLRELRENYGADFRLALEFDRDARNQHMITVTGWLQQAGIDPTASGIAVQGEAGGS